MATTIKGGWYGTATETYYVTEGGRVYLVQTDDLADLPRAVDSLPGDAEPIPAGLLDADLCGSVAGLDGREAL